MYLSLFADVVYGCTCECLYTAHSGERGEAGLSPVLLCLVFFSALARRILQKPVEIIVGEKGRTAAAVQQYVEVMEEERKFFR